MRLLAWIWLLSLMAAVGSAADLDSIKAEPNLERRAAKALENADHEISAARDAYSAGDMKKTKAALAEVAESVELSYEALGATGKQPRSSPKHFKHAEMSIRAMVRRLKNLEIDFSVDDRGPLFDAEQRLQKIHDDILNGIMSKKKKS